MLYPTGPKKEGKFLLYPPNNADSTNLTALFCIATSAAKSFDSGLTLESVGQNWKNCSKTSQPHHSMEDFETNCCSPQLPSSQPPSDSYLHAFAPFNINQYDAMKLNFTSSKCFTKCRKVVLNYKKQSRVQSFTTALKVYLAHPRDVDSLRHVLMHLIFTVQL